MTIFVGFRLAGRANGLYNHYGSQKRSMTASVKHEIKPIQTLLVANRGESDFS